VLDQFRKIGRVVLSELVIVMVIVEQLVILSFLILALTQKAKFLLKVPHYQIVFSLAQQLKLQVAYGHF